MDNSLKELVTKGKEQVFLPESEIKENLPKAIIDPGQIEDIFAMFEDMGIKVQR